MVFAPKEGKHRPYCKEECKIVFIEPSGTINTGGVGENLTVTELERFRTREEI
jgi:hypothetical protein